MVILSPFPRPFLAPPIVAKTFLGGSPLSEERVNWRGIKGGGDAESEDGGASTLSISNTWSVCRYDCWSFSDCESGVKGGLIVFLSMYEESSVFEQIEAGGDGGRV